MARIYMVRHGEAAASWGEHLDPGLSDLGWSQARAAADVLVEKGPMLIRTSPLQRTQDTAQPLAERWGQVPLITPEVAELPTPEEVTDRGPWLRGIMGGTWAEAGMMLRDWAASVADYVTALEEDQVIFSHFIAINVVVGRVTGSDKVVNFMPANCSITVFETDGKTLSLIAQGSESETKVN